MQQAVPLFNPIVTCGVTGPSQGWIEVPYAEILTQLHDIYQFTVKPTKTARNGIAKLLTGLAEGIPVR